MTQSHYSLRWNNHQSHILSAFDALLQAETLVDVTLVCAETSVRAHKVVLSACSPFFQRIFSENPCKHPVIVLKDFHGWEVQAIVDFMYKGEISVGQEQLQNLIKAAESLQVRGLAHHDQLAVDKESSSITNQTPTPSTSPNDYERFGRFPLPAPGTTVRAASERASPFSPPAYEPPLKLPHMAHPTFAGDSLLPRMECSSPLPRRKQARPRRRSGELCGAQDLSKPPTSPTQDRAQDRQPSTTQQQVEETAENLCMKKPVKREEPPAQNKPVEAHQQPPSHHQREHHHHHHHHHHQHHQRELKTEPEREPASPPELDLSMAADKEFAAASPPLGLPPVLLHPEHHLDTHSHSPLPFPPMPSVSALAMTPPHSFHAVFGLDSPLGLFPPGLDGCRNPLLDMTDPRTTPDTQMFTKKKIGRPKGQHSAPRGGPPRSWTNAELTEALQHVWNKKMTTSQASRIFGIPYNSLLMYVRGKYGKSLKLEQLRKDCIGGPGGPLDLLSLGGNNNNNQSKAERERDRSDRDREDVVSANTRPPSEELPPPVFNPFAPNFYPDFGSGFPIPVSMIHLLPQSEKNRENLAHPAGATGLDADDCKDRERERAMKELEDDQHDLFRPPALSRDERRELVQQNGQD